MIRPQPRPLRRGRPTLRHSASSLRHLLRACLQRLPPPLSGRLRTAIAWLIGQEGSPGHQARGLAAGVFTGCLPFFGLQILLGVALAVSLRGNRLLAAAGTWISNPLTTLPLCWLNYKVGALLLGPGPAWPALDELDGAALSALGWSFTSRLMLGSLLMGLVNAVVAGVLCWRWLHGRRQRGSPRR